MDKYTVDLDQVLNDFEYSELTDQYSNASSRNVGSTPTQNTVTKHSINNVFHSLNEYLNTNINVNPLNQIDNNILESVNRVDAPDVLNVGENHSKDAEESINDTILKTDELLVDINGEEKENGPGIFDRDITLEETSDSKDSDCINKDSLEAETSENVTVDSNREIEEMKDNGNNDKSDVKSSEGEKESESNESITIKEENKEECMEEECKIEDVSVEEQLNICKPVEDPEERKEEAIEDPKEEEPQKKIGFQEDIDLDDSEITKLLEELESEDIENVKESQNGEPTVGNCENAVETNENQATVTGQELSLVNDVQGDKVEENQESLLANVEDDTSKKIEVNVGESEALPTTGAGDSKEQEHFEVKDKDVDLKCDDTIKNTEKEERVNDRGGGDEPVLNEKIVHETDSVELQKDASQDSLSRPQNLPLAAERDEPKRKINLIGDPGSTPYNNVYINKEIPRNKDKEYDSDTDYSTSSSPTFSDASTTASTVSMDEAHVEGDKNPRNQTNTNKIVPEGEETSRIVSEAVNPMPTESPTSETANSTPDTENPTSESTLPASANAEVSESAFGGDEAGALAPQNVENIGEVDVNGINVGKQWLGKEAPLWIPDSDATSCLHCDMKFTVLKRRHHCRACGLVLCSKCCHLRFKLEYLDAEARVCNKCHDILNKDTASSSGSDLSPEQGNSPSQRPNPNNPLEYCSTVSPLQQAAGSNPNPPAVMVPVGVLKRKGSNKAKSNKSVMFCDGIRPGSDLTNLDNDFDYNNTKTKKTEKTSVVPSKVNRNLPTVDPQNNTFIPSNENMLPPTVIVFKTDISYTECTNGPSVVEILRNEQLTFAIHVNLHVHLKIINMSCCINKMAWCFSTEGLINVGQDEVVVLLEYIDEESFVPKDVFYHINNVYNDAVKGNSVKEMGLSLHNASNFLDSKNHAGFVYIRPTFQCLENVIKPKEPYLIGILIHRWETPWAKLFPLRLILRLGAEYRYYPSPIISTRHRESVFVEIGHTIINLLADFRNFSYTLPQIRGLTIHMEDKNTTITIPVNRYDQVMKSINNSSDHILAFAGNFSAAADSHLVCMQDTQGNDNCYSTHAINIHNKPRKITGASFIVFNGALKSSSGLTAKSNIVEDGLMIQVLPEHMQQIRDNLRAMKDHTISCGCVNAASDETVNIVWGENDVNFNVGIVSSIDNMPLSGIPSIRVHNGKNHVCINGSRLIRWTEVFIIKSGDDNPKSQDPVDVSRVSESIAKATCDALIKYLDLLVANGCQKVGIRTTLHVDNVSYLAGSNGAKLAPIYMKSLDDELIPVLHRITTNNLGENAIVLELIFRILNV